MGNNKDILLSLIGIDAEIAYSKTDVWVWYKLPTESYEFKTGEDREFMANSINTAIASMMIDPRKGVDAHLCITSKPLNINHWREAFLDRGQKWEPAPGFEQYVDDTYEFLANNGYMEKEVFLGVHLGKRSTSMEEGNPFAAAFKTLTSLVDDMLQTKDLQIPEKEITYWRGKARNYTRALSQGHLKARPATAEEIARLTKQTLYPAMPMPEVTTVPHERWGRGEILALAESYIENNRKFLKITQTDNFGQDMEGYRATLCFSRFPDVLEFPAQEPWMHFLSMLGFGVSLYARFRVEPSDAVRKDVGRKLQMAKDQAKNATEGGGELPIALQEQLQTATSLQHTLDREKTPWVYGRYRVVVEADTEDALRDTVQRVIDHYRDLNIEVTWPSGDQFSLLLESQPADKIRRKDYEQRQSLSVIAAGMPTASSSAGDEIINNQGWRGPFLGETTSRIREAVFFSPHVPIAQNNPPGVLITGSPGGGKSFTAFTLTCQMAMQGIWCIYIDPKADAVPMSNLEGLGNVNVFDLANGAAGLLDPFRLAEQGAEQQMMAIETIKLLLGKTDLPNAQEAALYAAVKTVAGAAEPSLNKVVDHLLRMENGSPGHTLGETLDLLRQLKYANLCFSAQKQINLRPEDGLTIVTLLGLDLPPAELPKNQYKPSNHLAVAIMYLISTFTLALMSSKDKLHPKAIIIDEAWAITSTTEGKAMIPKIARLGRSLNTALILVSQNAGDFASEGFVNSMSTYLAFRAKSKDEVDGVIELFQLENDEFTRNTVRSLNNGECLMKDSSGRLARVQVSNWNKEWSIAFETNPEKKAALDKQREMSFSV